MDQILENKRILITGGAGSIGSELARQLSVNNKVFLMDISEGAYVLREELKQEGRWCHSRIGDIRDKEAVHDVFDDFKPQYVFHAAALKHVAPNEEYPEEAFATNLQGTINLVREAKNWECLIKFVFISTDKVVNAHSMMGISKLAAESYVRKQDKRFVAVRFGNVLESSGSLLEIWKKQLEKGLPLTITDPDMERYFMSIPEACELVITAAKTAKGRLVILDMGKPKRLMDVLREFEEEHNLKFYPNKVIGMRPGETLKEKLMTEEEKVIVQKEGNFYFIN